MPDDPFSALGAAPGSLLFADSRNAARPGRKAASAPEADVSCDTESGNAVSSSRFVRVSSRSRVRETGAVPDRGAEKPGNESSVAPDPVQDQDLPDSRSPEKEVRP